MRTRPGVPVRPPVSTGAAVGSGVLTAIVVCLAATAILGVALHFTSLSERVLPAAATAVAAISVFAGGVQAGVRSSHAGWLHGGVSGALFSIGMWLLAGVAFDIRASLSALIIRLACGFAIGVAGGVFGINMQGDRR